MAGESRRRFLLAMVHWSLTLPALFKPALALPITRPLDRPLDEGMHWSPESAGDEPISDNELEDALLLFAPDDNPVEEPG